LNLEATEYHTMSDRYTDRDCYAALIRLAARERAQGLDAAVSVPRTVRKGDWRQELREFAKQMEVPARIWSETTETAYTYALDYAPSVYGGGVRPALHTRGCSGHDTVRWWVPSAGLGPGAVPRKEFVHICGAIEGFLYDLENKQREAKTEAKEIAS